MSNFKTTPHRRALLFDHWHCAAGFDGPIYSKPARLPWAKDSQEDVLPKRDSEAFDYLLICVNASETKKKLPERLAPLLSLHGSKLFTKQDCQTW